MEPGLLLRASIILLVLCSVTGCTVRKHRLLRVLCMIGGAAGFAGVMAAYAVGPFHYHHEFNNALFALSGRAHLRFGFSETLGMDLWNGGPQPPLFPVCYLNHPPFCGWMTALSMALFGDSEWAVRLATMLPLMAGLSGFALLVRKSPFDAGSAFWLVAFGQSALSYYGRITLPGTFALSLLFPVAGVLLAGKQTRGALVLLGGCAMLLPLTSWTGCLFAATLIAALFVLRAWRLLLVVLPAAGAGYLVLLLLLAHAYAWDLGPLFDQFLRRSVSGQSESGDITSARHWLAVVFRHARLNTGLVPFLLACAGLAGLPRKRQVRVTLAWAFGTSLLLVAILRQWAFVHDFSVCSLSLAVTCLGVRAWSMIAVLDHRVARGVASLLVAVAAGWGGLEDLKKHYRVHPVAVESCRLGTIANRAVPPGACIGRVRASGAEPRFHYYADRDMVLWPHPAFDEGYRPEAMVQVHGRFPRDPAFMEVLDDYKRSALSPRIFLRRDN